MPNRVVVTILLTILYLPFPAVAKEEAQQGSVSGLVNKVKERAKKDIQSIKREIPKIKEQAKKDAKSIKNQAEKDVKPVKGWLTTVKEKTIEHLKSIRDFWKEKFED